MRKEQELERMMDLYQNLIFSICLQKTGDYFIAEDVTQETFLAAYRALDRFDGTYEKAWLCRIALNKCIDWARKISRQKETGSEEEEDKADSYSLEGEIMSREAVDEIRKRCEQLKSPYREVALAYFLEERTPKEIAQMQQKNLHTVQTQIDRARKMLRKYYRKEDGVCSQ